MKFLTLHVRLTRDCNAHCSYCSSAGVSEGRMSVEDFRSAIDFIADRVLPRMGISPSHFLTVEYLGGEVLVVPPSDLKECVSYARARLGLIVGGFRDGAQSNLIGTPRRVIDLHDLFEGNLGTSWDRHSGQRHIKGSAQIYQGILDRSLRSLSDERGHVPGRVLVIDAATAPHLLNEVADSIDGGYDLVLRPVFQGGSPDVDAIPPAQLADLMRAAYRLWSDTKLNRIEPFSSLHHRRAQRGLTDVSGARSALSRSGCPFQSDCAFKSLSLDPDGTLHVCQEMADAGHYPLGNAITGTFDEPTWRLLARRTMHLSESCAACEWRDECGGGCMNEAIEAFNDPFAKTELCPAWKAIFAEIEADLGTMPTPSS